MSELAVGQKIELSDGRTGTICFVGSTAFAAGDWVGIELDDDSGKNDGSVQGERYFNCDMGRGMFVRPTTVTVLAQPPPKPAAAAKKTSRPSSLFTSGATRASGNVDPGLNKRMSLNAPSPSPVPRGSRPSSLVRSPAKSPTKQFATASSSAATSRTGTPSNARPGVGTKPPRPSVGGPSRPSMGPPPRPASGTSRQVSSSSTSRTTAAPSRTLSGRLQTGGRPGLTRPGSGRNMSQSSLSGVDSGSGKTGEGATSPRKSSDDEILSPQPTSPVQARTRALEKLAGGTPPAPRAAPSTTTAPRPSVSAAASHKEVEDLKAKLRVLEKKRMEDREKLNSLEKIKGERDKFERIIQTLQIKYQPQTQENSDLKRALKEAESRLYEIEEIQAEHESAMELATLDREMAEETAEMLKAELEAVKQKAEELELEVEILREENAEFTNGMSPDERASTGWLQMERNNERLREALLRLRDMTQQQEEELRDQIKGLEEDLRELEPVKEQHDAVKEKLAQAEAAVEDLREQLNNALGAEDLIESLTEQTMNQSEEIKELRAVIDDLESLKEINDELEINHVQNEKELQEELDLKDSIITEQIRQAAVQKETFEDMEYTLSRFRELVTSLQSDLEDMRASHAVTENESEQLNSRSRAMMDLNMKLQISAAKAQVKTIDLELRRMEAQEAEQHLEIVKLFLPETYQSDRDSVLALLRFKRLAFKANLLNNFIKERVNGQSQPGHEDDIFEGCDAIDKLTWVSAMCDRFVNAISHCSLEQFAKYEGALYELEPVERALNGWIDGLRRDDLKEKQCATELQRTIALMTHLGEVHISTDLESFADDVHMRALLMQSHLESSAVVFTALRAMVQRVVPPNEEEDELAQYFSKKAEAVISQTRSTKVIAGKTVRGLEDLKTRSLSLTPETAEAFESCERATQELAAMARRIGLELHRLLHEEGRTNPYTYAEVQNWVQQLAHSIFSSLESDLFSTYLTKLRLVTGQISDIAALSSDLTQTQEFERSAQPWILRSRELRALRTVPVDAEEELRRLKDDIQSARRDIAVREESLSTAQVKIETLESRMRDANAKASKIIDLETQIQLAKQQATSLQDDIQKQDRELKVLEADRDKWKKIASDSRLVMDNVAGSNEKGAAGTKARQERAVATAREMDALRDEILALQSAVRYLREDSRRARLTEQGGYDWLAEPLRKPASVQEQRRNMVVAEGRVVLGELVKLAGQATVYDLGQLPKKVGELTKWKPARSTPQWHVVRQREEYENLKGWEGSVLRKSVTLKATGSAATGAVGSAADARKRAARSAVAKLQIRLPTHGDRKGAITVRGEVQIVGSREWEGLQGKRLAAVL
ncbi:dynein associated protein-domain-containing protein [Apodospora peruviana]|uniref:Dynein associated protein-domain-containing protein n=1 Tax=Apodospora peruviana TaxID=516989 RepID=A0AAE0HXL8_9PEZI|nr:dynein associated protein-domain-containing protein [Apodospora peruviana]